MLKKILLTTGAISIAALSTISAVSCASDKPLSENGDGDNPSVPKPTSSSQTLGSKSIVGRADHLYTTSFTKDNGFGADVILSKESYNSLYDEMMTHNESVAIAIIADGKVRTDIVEITKGETVLEALDSSKFILKRYMHESMGAFINSFATRSKPNVFMHGTNTEKNYGDYYPMYYINHNFAQLGVSNFHLAGHEMLEFSYDKK